MAAVCGTTADSDPGSLDPAAADWREGRRMTGWIPVILLVLAAFLVTAFVLKLERPSSNTLGSVLAFRLSGHALQGSPDLPTTAKMAEAATAPPADATVPAPPP